MAEWSLILLCCSLGASFGAGLHEHVVFNPLWSKSPPASFRIIQAGTGVLLQWFWVPLHAAITVFMLLSVFWNWSHPPVRPSLLIAAVSYVVLRVWSFLFFIPEMSAFQNIPVDTAPTPELSARVARWTSWTCLRTVLDLVSLLCSLWALYWRV